jgi:hypothetical protein
MPESTDDQTYGTITLLHFSSTCAFEANNKVADTKGTRCSAAGKSKPEYAFPFVSESIESCCAVSGDCSAESGRFDFNYFVDAWLGRSILHIDASGHAIDSTFLEQSLEDLIDGRTGPINKKVANRKRFIINQIIEMTTNVTGYRHGFFLLSGRSEKHQFFFPAENHEKASDKVQFNGEFPHRQPNLVFLNQAGA